MVMALAAALLMVCLFMISYYKLPGVLSCMTLLFQMALQVLAICNTSAYDHAAWNCRADSLRRMAVDANIIISERISEELRNKASVRWL